MEKVIWRVGTYSSTTQPGRSITNECKVYTAQAAPAADVEWTRDPTSAARCRRVLLKVFQFLRELSTNDNVIRAKLIFQITAWLYLPFEFALKPSTKKLNGVQQCRDNDCGRTNKPQEPLRA